MSRQAWRTTQLKQLARIEGWCFSLAILISVGPLAQGQAAPAPQPAPATTQAPSTTPGAAAAPATAQDAATQAGTVSSRTNEVSLDLVVHDKKHKAILDLKAEDFAVTDDDTPVKLSGLRLIRGDEAVSTGHMITLIFDHFDPVTARSAKIVADKMLKVFPAKGYAFSVLDFSGRLRLIQGFTDDRSKVESAVDLILEKTPAVQATTAEAAEKNLISIARTGADPSGRHADIRERAKAQTLLKALGDAQLIVQDQHARQSLAGLLALVKSQQDIPERKALIYFTQNEQMDSKAKDMIRTISGAATKAGVSIYTIDLDALDAGGKHQMVNAMLNGQAPFSPVPIATSAYTTVTPLQQQSAAPIAGTPSMQGNKWTAATDMAMATDFMRGNNEDPNRFLEIKSPMADLAKDTGGLYIDAQNNVRAPFQQMLQDMSTYYEATYVPPIQEYDGKFRAIGIKPLRAGLNIQTRTGYFALAPGASGGIRPFEVPLMKLLGEAKLPSDFKFNATVLRFGDLPDGNTNTLAVEVPLSELDKKEDVHTNLYSAHVSIVAEIKDAKGTVVEHFGEDLARRGALESLDRDKSTAVTMQRHFIETPGKYELNVGVFDQNNQKVSAQRINFEIPAVSGGPALSDMVLVRKMDTFNEESDPLEPLRYEKGKVTPNLSGVVNHESKSVSMFLILHPDPQIHEPVTLEMEVIRNGQPGRRTPLPLRAGDTDQTIPYLATFQSKSLAPGDYEVKAMMNQGGKTAVQLISFTVEGTDDAESADSKRPGGGLSPADPNSVMPDLLPDAPGQLAFTVPSATVPPPTPEDVRLLIADARERALKYTDTLPNFLCVQVTNRSVDAAGRGRWKLKDTMAELLRYHDQKETRDTIEVNGKASGADRASLKGTFSSGELGGVLKAVFQDSAKAEFKFKETDVLGDQTVQVFDYKVASANSEFGVTGSNSRQIIVGFHGQVYFDTATRSVRRISLIADDLPKDFPTRATAIRVDYDYVMINAHDYLMPVGAEVSLQQGRREATLNTIQFRDYRRYGSTVKLNFDPDQKH